MARLLVTLALAVYNNVANLWPPFNRAAYVPANMLAAGALLVVATQALGLSRRELGLERVELSDAAVGVAIGLVVVAPLLAAARTEGWSHLVADRRVDGLRGRALAYQTLIRVPLGTALLEEIAFRGVLFAAWRDADETAAWVVSSCVFGLWHIAPATTMVRVNDPSAGGRVVARAVAGTVVLTAIAGAALVWLRVETGSLAAPFAAHATVNSLATFAGARAGRRAQS